MENKQKEESHLFPVFRNFRVKTRSICQAKACYFHPILRNGDPQKALEFHILLSCSTSGWVLFMFDCFSSCEGGSKALNTQHLPLPPALAATGVSMRGKSVKRAGIPTSVNQVSCRADVKRGTVGWSQVQGGRWLPGEVKRPQGHDIVLLIFFWKRRSDEGWWRGQNTVILEPFGSFFCSQPEGH